MFSSMVVHDLDGVGIALLSLEADAPPVVDPDAVLSQTIAVQGLKVVSRNRREIGQRRRGVQMIQLPLCHTVEPGVLSRLFTVKQLRRIFRPKRADHVSRICRLALNGKRQTHAWQCPERGADHRAPAVPVQVVRPRADIPADRKRIQKRGISGRCWRPTAGNAGAWRNG